jgi:hypothetical protein
MSHAADSDTATMEKLVQINIWHSQQLKYIADKLAAAPESDGTTMLDNTLMLWGNELGKGNTHTYKDIPWMLLGGGGGLRMGRYLQYPSTPHNNLLTTILNAFGYADVKNFGDTTVGTGPLTNLV